jgi:hypothetical protein
MYKQSDIRDYEIKETYFIVFREAAKSGKSAAEARHEAFAAIELRYSLSRSRARNIIRANIRVTDSIYAAMFRDRNLQIIELGRMIHERLIRETP